jgi:hypothetical protein
MLFNISERIKEHYFICYKWNKIPAVLPRVAGLMGGPVAKRRRASSPVKY